MTIGAGGDELDVERLLAWLAASDVTYFKLRIDKKEVVYSRRPDGPDARPMAHAPADTVTRGAPEPTTVAPAPGPAPMPAAVPAPATNPALPGDIEVTAPMVGIFHRAPAPGAPPYVEPAQRVAATATVGLMESMKIFTAVPAGTAGVVVAVLAANGQSVERGQPLVRVRPDAVG
ncbi:MAG: acetyl-CoA carboxylase biotin carboxyl carrier protein [Acidimicrobiales bacterium]